MSRFMQELFSLCRLHPPVTALSHGRRDTSVDLVFFLERDISALFKTIKELFNFFICLHLFFF